MTKSLKKVGEVDNERMTNSVKKMGKIKKKG